MKSIFSFIFKLTTFLSFLILSYNSYSQTNQCNNNAGGELTVGTSCVTSPMNTDSNNDYWNGATGCNAADRDDKWAWFVATSTSTTITYTPDSQDAILTLFTGACSNTMGSLDCSNDNGAGGVETIVYATTIGTTYRIRIQRNNSNQLMEGDICVYSSAPAVSNDDPCSATALTAGATCINTTGTNSGATASTGVTAPGCASYSGGDVWYSVTVPASGEITITTSTAGGFTDAGMATYSGTCSSLTLLNCDDDGGAGTFSEIEETGLTPGSTIFIRVWEYGNDNFGDFNICVVEPTPVVGTVPNDTPCTATSLTVGALGVCTNTTGTNDGATSSTGSPAPGCASYSGGDVWYTAVVPASGTFTITTSDAGGFTDAGMATYSGTCASLTLLNCNDDGATGLFSEIEETGLTPGATIYIRVWEYGNDNFGDFNICAFEAIPPNICGESGTNVNTNDFCSTPATLTLGGTSFSASTAATFTEDNPASVESTFCGTIENNSWYEFEASSTTESFDITSVLNCSAGIQGEVYEVTYDANGCCTGFTSVSNCYNPASTTLGTITATGLTVGTNYLLMIDGNGGANCDFTIDGWSGANILPVELIGLFGHTLKSSNYLTWTTNTEINNDYFILEKSLNGIDYTTLGHINGNGNSTSKIDYNFTDSDINNALTYYRLTQVDYNGTTEELGTVKVKRELANVFAFPNPSKNELFFTFNSEHNSNILIQYINPQGQIVSEQVNTIDNSTFTSTVFKELPSGIYYTNVLDHGNIIESLKVIKL